MQPLPGPWITLAAVALVTIIFAALALGLQPSTGVDTLVSSSSADYQATQRDAQQFGSSAVVVLVHDPLTDLIKPRQLRRISKLEACLDGQQLKLDSDLGSLQPVPSASAKPYGGAGSPCGELMRERVAKVVYGPGTFLNHAVAAVNEQILTLTKGAASVVKRAESNATQIAAAQGLDSAEQQRAAKAAGELALQQQLGSLGSIADEAGVDGTPSISDSAFLRQIVFRDGGASGEPSAKFSYLFPTPEDALIQVRLRAGLTDAQQSQAIRRIRAAVGMPRFRLSGASYKVTGEPVVLADVASEISGQLLQLLIGVVIVMGIVLLAIFRRRPRLLPLVIALAAAAITFGVTALIGASLTMASIAVLPILIGLTVDYAVQFQSGTARASIGAAALATAAGFLALLLSPVPMVRGFGLLLVLGVFVALLLTRIVVPAVAAAGRTGLRTGQRDPGASSRDRVGRSAGGSARGLTALAGGVTEPVIAASLGAADILRDGVARIPRATAPSTAAVVTALTKRPFVVLAVAVLLSGAGWALEAQTPVQSDITKLVPSGTPALHHLRTLERTTGVSGEIDVLVHGRDVATPAAVQWMVAYQDRVERHFGYKNSETCSTATLCPALSLPDLFGSSTSGKTSKTSSTALTQRSIDALLKTVPNYFKQAVLTSDRRYATLAFGIRLMPLSKQRRLIAYLRSQLHPPAGLSAQLAGLPVLAADADSSLSSSGRRLLTVGVGLLLVALVLLAVLRRPRRALIPLIPIVLATGWSALIVYLLGVSLNPLSATLGALVIAISTEFSVLLSERVRSERRGSGRAARELPLSEAMVAAYRSTGVAVVTSGVTVIMGFGVLILSNIAMLSDFGLVTLIDMTVSLIGVLAILPAVLTAAERVLK